MGESIVGIERVENLRDARSVKTSLCHLMNSIRKRGVVNIPSNATILVKPNLCTVKGPETGATVDPLVVKFFIEWLFENYSIEKVVVAEADATWLNADIAFEVLGWKRMLSPLPNVQILNLSKDKRICVKLEEAHFFDVLEMSKTYMEADFLVSFGKLKTNDICGMTCILKNQFGSLPEKYKAQYHEHLSEVIFDLNKVRIPDLSVVDGLIAMEGDGPVDGVPKPLGLLIAGNDPVSTDHACASIMRMRISNVPYLRFAIRKGLGQASYETFGAEIKGVKAKFVEPSPWRTLAVKYFRHRHPLDLWVSRALSKIVFPSD